jgi:hypothetical protein
VALRPRAQGRCSEARASQSNSAAAMLIPFSIVAAERRHIPIRQLGKFGLTFLWCPHVVPQALNLAMTRRSVSTMFMSARPNST